MKDSEIRYFQSSLNVETASVAIQPLDAKTGFNLISYYEKHATRKVVTFEGEILRSYRILRGHRAVIIGNGSTYIRYCQNGSDDDFLRFQTFLKNYLKNLESGL